VSPVRERLPDDWHVGEERHALPNALVIGRGEAAEHDRVIRRDADDAGLPDRRRQVGRRAGSRCAQEDGPDSVG
jgi:hypothetical protein